MKLSISRFWRVRNVLYKLLLSYCKSCGKYHYPPKPICPYCNSNNVELKKSKGIGRVRYWTTSYLRIEGFEDKMPIIFAIVELEEGVLVKGVIVDSDNISEGMKVEGVLRRLVEDGDSGIIYYGIKFKPIK